MGHSRIAYLAAALMCRRAEEIDFAASFSGFKEPAFNESVIEQNRDRFEKRKVPLFYLMTAGENNTEEEGYLKDLTEIQQYLLQNPISMLKSELKGFPYAGHMANYNFSVAHGLKDYFGTYSQFLIQWIFQKANKLDEGQILKSFLDDEKELEEAYGKPMCAEPVHYISVGNALLQRQMNWDALALLEEGLNHYPSDWEMKYLQLYALNELGQKEELARELDKALSNLALYNSINENEKSETIDAFNEFAQP